MKLKLTAILCLLMGCSFTATGDITQKAKQTKMLNDYLQSIHFGEVQTFKNLTVIPLLSVAPEGVAYLTLKEVLAQKTLTITELDEGGSVPELKAQNKSPSFILMLDGEQIEGAKQNRILNTSILMKHQSELVIPVSCTEQGRWHYETEQGESNHEGKKFKDAANIMPSKMRLDNKQAVSKSLKQSGEARSNQSSIWKGVAEYQEKAQVPSETKALQDVYKAKETAINQYINAFKVQPNQKGLLVLIHGKVVGFDIVSRASAYSVLHPKLISSYAMDAMTTPSHRKMKKGEAVLPPVQAKAFLETIKTVKGERFPSVDQGESYRYEDSKVVGSALVHEDVVIHTSFFAR